MPLQRRLIRVTLQMPSGDVVLDESLDLRVTVHKDALAIMNRATIDVTGLTAALREQLLTQFTAWNKRLLTNPVPGAPRQNYVAMKIEAGYEGTAERGLNLIFTGFIVCATPTTPPPNIGVKIDCFSRQLDKTAHVTEPAPASMTYKDYVAWAAKAMGFGDRFTCQTSFDNEVITNPSRSSFNQGALLIDIQSYKFPLVAAFIDNDELIVKDINKIIDRTRIVQVTEFIGIPQWNEWGIDFTCLFTPNLRLAGGASLTSLLNPSIDGEYVVMGLEYELASRDTPFYVKASVSPPAA